MSGSIIADFIGYAFAGLFAITGWVFTMIFGKIKTQSEKHDELSTKLTDHELHSAENFVVKTDLSSFIDRIMIKLDKIDDNLNKKADK